MNNTGFLKVVIVSLLAINLATVGSIWFNHPPHKMPPPPPDVICFLNDKLQLSDEQKNQMISLKEQHLNLIHNLMDKNKSLHNRFFSLIKNADASESMVQSLADSIAIIQSAMDISTYNHLKDLKNICTPEQQKKFDMVLNDATRMMFPQPNHPDKNCGQAGGPDFDGHGNGAPPHDNSDCNGDDDHHDNDHDGDHGDDHHHHEGPDMDDHTFSRPLAFSFSSSIATLHVSNSNTISFHASNNVSAKNQTSLASVMVKHNIQTIPFTATVTAMPSFGKATQSQSHFLNVVLPVLTNCIAQTLQQQIKNQLSPKNISVINSKPVTVKSIPAQVDLISVPDFD